VAHEHDVEIGVIIAEIGRGGLARRVSVTRFPLTECRDADADAPSTGGINWPPTRKSSICGGRSVRGIVIVIVSGACAATGTAASSPAANSAALQAVKRVFAGNMATPVLIGPPPQGRGAQRVRYRHCKNKAESRVSEEPSASMISATRR
jgi:hypothetical protein